MKKKTIRIIGVPMDLGQNHRGVDMGPSAIRYADLAGSLNALGYKTADCGDITIPGHYALTNTSLKERLPLIGNACRTAYELGKKAIKRGKLPSFWEATILPQSVRWVASPMKRTWD
ncbi:hypothetical protein DGMP_30340 [Desulfomarina profundi]|uniref:Arginase n=1 Tax=Desulfomarina profundi TaxID=2772557 RepID=A0A8D5FKN0_9BACT|nr:arginase family protein [Desulfomarina profundi]BCL62341.1 hypothetical protein DGMP_30340 [Desulfomarina profundi]